MKSLLTLFAVIICSLTAYGQSAQYRPTPFANGFVQTINSQGTAQTYLGIPSSTNTALLNQSQTWTGTPTFPASFFISNGIREHRLFYTNVFVANVVYATNATYPATPTNAGDSVHVTVFVDADMPALQSSNSSVYFNLGWSVTNANAERSGALIYCGTNTNCVFFSQSYTGNGTTVPFLWNDSAQRRLLFSNFGSWTNQIVFLHTAPTFRTNLTGFFLVDTSTNWNLKFALNAFTTTPNSNYLFFVRVVEIVD